MTALPAGPAYGVIQTIADLAVTDAASASGFDFLILDQESAAIDDTFVVAALDRLAAASTCGAVRLRGGDIAVIPHFVAAGASILLMPDVRSAADARAFAAAAGAEVLLLAMIESRDGVDAADAIAATPGIGGLLIGPRDLAAQLGVESTDSDYVDAFEAVEQAAHARGIRLGTRPHSGFPLARLIDGGHSVILMGSDKAAVTQGFAALRTGLA